MGMYIHVEQTQYALKLLINTFGMSIKLLWITQNIGGNCRSPRQYRSVKFDDNDLSTHGKKLRFFHVAIYQPYYYAA